MVLSPFYAAVADIRSVLGKDGRVIVSIVGEIAYRPVHRLCRRFASGMRLYLQLKTVIIRCVKAKVSVASVRALSPAEFMVQVFKRGPNK